MTAEMGQLVIPLHDLDSLGKDYSFALDHAWLEHVLEGTGVHADKKSAVGSLNVHAQMNGREVLVHGHMHTSLVTECCRCLEDAIIPVDLDVATLLSPADADPHARADEIDDEVEADSPDVDVYHGDKVVLDDLVREHILLEVPIQPLCKEDCPGIAVPEHIRGPEHLVPTDSEGKPVDPRLAPLMKLARRGEPEEE